MNKKGVSDVVATILIILLVLAAIIIVWQVVSKVVKGGAASVAERSKCIDVNLEFVEHSVTCNKTNPGIITAKVTRGGDSAGDVDMKLVIDATVLVQEVAPSALATITPTIPADVNATGKSSVTVKVAPVVGENKEFVCNPADEVTVTCVS